MEHREIERRWLVTQLLPEHMPAVEDSFRLEQGYWETPTPAQSIRVRIVDSTQALVTVKVGTGIVRAEHEYPVAVSLGYHLLETCPHRLEKTRDRMGLWLLDRFASPLDGIVLLERELTKVDEAVTLPPWVARIWEVTETLTSRDLARIATRLRKKGGNAQDAVRRLLAKRR